MEHGLDERHMDRMPIVRARGGCQLEWPELGSGVLSGSGLERLGRRTEIEGAIDISRPRDEVPVGGHHGHRPIVKGFDQTRAGLSG
jgi:hypothetical protein